MKTEASISDFSLARRMYTPEVRYLIHGFREKTRRDVVRQDWWSASFSDSSVYSRDLGILLADPESIAAKNKPGDILDGDMQQIQFLTKMIELNLIKALIERKQQAGQLHMLDLMSYGAVNRELGVAGCAVALCDRRNEEQPYSRNKEVDKAIGLEFIDGDILYGYTWSKINQYLTKHAINGFSLILCHPIAALDNIPQNIGVYRYIFNHVYRTLDPNQGIFLTNFHPSMFERVDKVSRQLNTIDGIEATCYPAHFLSSDGKFMLKRSPNSPKRLPLID